MKKTLMKAVAILGTLCLLAVLASAQAVPAAPVDPELMMAQRFSKALGVDVNKVVQHYYLVKNGGVIEYTARSDGDRATVAAVQKFLDNQKLLFEKGKSDTDFEVHGKVPDGIPAMKRLRNEITFFSTKTENGAVLRMFSMNPEARDAIQTFLKFEIAEHKTGDSPTIDQ